MLDDLRFALRTFAKSPGFAIVAALTMALGIGANTAVFSLVNAVLLRPLSGVAEPDRLVSFYRVLKAESFDNLDYPDYADYRDTNQSFSGIAAHCPAMVTFNLHGAERIAGDLVTENYFDVLGVKPAIGRLLLPGDDAAVISYALWERKFGHSPDVLGSRLLLNGSPFVVAGVAARGFRGTAVNEAFDVWVPLTSQPKLLARLSPGILQDRAAGWIQVFGRLKHGVELRQAQAEITALSAQLIRSHSESKPVALAGNFGMYPDDRAEVSGLLGLLSSAVALLLLIACANVAGLFLVKASGRTREIAVRLAIGATRVRIFRQLVTEGLLLALMGGAIGLLFSQWASAAVLSIIDRVPMLRAVEVAVDFRVLGVTLLASLIAGALFAAAPAFQWRKLDLIESLKSGLPGSGQRRDRLRTALIGGQVALAFVLLSASAVSLRDLYRILHAAPGFETKRAVIMTMDLTGLNYSAERGLAFQHRLLEQIDSVPGVSSASLASTIPPYDLSGRISLFYPGQEPPQKVFHGHEFELGLRVDLETVAPRYFETLAIPILQGRDFTDRDRGVAIVGRRLADRLWPGEDPVGKHISWPAWSGPARPPLEIVGVARDVKYRSLITDPSLLIYVPMQSNYDGRAKIVVRTASDPRAVAADVERAARELDKDVPLFNMETMTDHIASSLWQQRMAANWITTFSLMAIILAAVGLYTVVARSVAQRTREVGIRMALGAKPQAVARLIVLEGMQVAVLGLALGIPAGFGFHRMLRRMISGIGSEDPVSVIAIAILVTGVLLLASWIPARRAAHVDPMEVLRAE
ncbi:MAG TPA: ABC transporter permease [Bryobacteraceae bacterium]|jgi:predicted permease|nr:ABC transporter permease [Bryobacteraceae bacterium]